MLCYYGLCRHWKQDNVATDNVHAHIYNSKVYIHFISVNHSVAIDKRRQVDHILTTSLNNFPSLHRHSYARLEYIAHVYKLALHPFVIYAPHALPTLCVPSSIPILSPSFLYHPYIPSF